MQDNQQLAHANFFQDNELTPEQALQITREGLAGMDDGELFLEYSSNESLLLEEGEVKKATHDSERGFGLRAIRGEETGFAYSGEISRAALKRAASSVQAIKAQSSGSLNLAPSRPNQTLYGNENPFADVSLSDRIKLLQSVDTYLRQKDERVKQAFVSLNGNLQVVEIVRPDGRISYDVRPMIRLFIQVVMQSGELNESGHSGFGGRKGYRDLLDDPAKWQPIADQAIAEGATNLQAQEITAGELEVVLGPGWPGVMLHEAVGHGLEADFNRKNLSIFSGRIGEQVASRDVTVIDDGSIPLQRGSLQIDDEGTVSKQNVLIENGKLVNYMQDRYNARLLGLAPTGNGRRQSYAHLPMPRMTNTFMAKGKYQPEEILASLKRGIYAVNFHGGQVDISSGNYVFNCTEAYWVENGKVQYPVKKATIIGNGPDTMQKVTMVGNDLKLDNGVGNCGKNGQWVPVCVGQPTLKISAITVGGTK